MGDVTISKLEYRILWGSVILLGVTSLIAIIVRHFT